MNQVDIAAGAKGLSFIRKSMSRIIDTLNEDDNEILKDLLADFFYIEKAEEMTGETAAKKPSIPTIVPKKKLFSISQINGGFKVKFIGEKKDIPKTNIIKIAYNVGSGNALNNFSSLDFDIQNKSQINIKENDCKILKAGPNMIEFIVKKSSAELEVSGFDENRDLVIDVQEKKT